MTVGVLKWAALALSVALGIGAGAGAAYLTAGEEPSDPAAGDPLGLGVPLVNQTCTGKSIIVIGRGSTRVALRTAVVEYEDARYLDTAASCPALYAPLDQPAPEYVAYLGPYDDKGAACERRMAVEHRGDVVTTLSPGNQTYVKCPCELSVGTWPVLTPGMGPPDAYEGMWIRQLQGMLVDLGRLVDDEDETGRYDAKTVSVVRRMQGFALLEPDGVVDAETWENIRDRACRTYEDY